eukprot:m.339440 g.339440  ORF g.339440 m.339440 type:complete len:491 (-) comp18806_c0_seq1:54-1526(-)
MGKINKKILRKGGKRKGQASIGDVCANSYLQGMMAVVVVGMAILSYRSSYELKEVKLDIISLPTTEKLEKVKRDEALRAKINSRKRNSIEEKEYKAGYEKNQFNQWISDQMPLDRWAYDTRDISCLDRRYISYEQLPTTSVVIIFYNEARSTLLRTVVSVLTRSTPRLIKEILLVDDGSEMPHLGKPLDEELEAPQFEKVRVLRIKERGGLIRAKVVAAKEATGDVLLFLDSHCEANDGWLEPLLDAVKRDRTTVAMPIIDAVQFETWEWRTGVLERGVFDWTQKFFWMQLTPEDHAKRKSKSEPYISPAMAGGLFAMDRKYFFEIGAYDMGMETWGGENIEMSLRVWMCGGRLLVLPCSHVAHVFREKSPYKFKNDDPAGTIGYNQNRAAEVWMDDHKERYYMNTDNKKYGYGNITDRIKFREEHNCKSFQWYIDTIYPELKELENKKRKVQPDDLDYDDELDSVDDKLDDDFGDEEDDIEEGVLGAEL